MSKKIIACVVAGLSMIGAARAEIPVQHEAMAKVSATAYHSACLLGIGKSQTQVNDQFNRILFGLDKPFRETYGVSLFDAVRSVDQKEAQYYLEVAVGALQRNSQSENVQLCKMSTDLVDGWIKPLMIQATVVMWLQENDTCRGSMNKAISYKACDEREVYSKKLASLGWCYGERQQFGSQMKWHQCTKNSLR